MKLSQVSAFGRVILFLLLAIGAVALGQDKPKEYKPTEVQTLRLQNKQLVAQIAQRDLQAAQQRFQTALVDLTAEAEKVKVENNWAKDVAFDPNTLSYSAPVKEVKK